jgi:hypothetical protein
LLKPVVSENSMGRCREFLFQATNRRSLALWRRVALRLEIAVQDFRKGIAAYE